MRTDIDTIITPGRDREPMAMADAGTITKTDGTNGGVLVKLRPDVDYAGVFGAEFLFVVTDGGVVPMRMAKTTRRGDRAATVELANICTADQAAPLVGCKIRSEAAAALGQEDDEDMDEEPTLVGYAVLTEEDGTVGEIEAIDDSVAANPLFIVRRTDGTELMLPAADDFVMSLDDDAKTITLRLPKGLLNLDEAEEA